MYLCIVYIQSNKQTMIIITYGMIIIIIINPDKFHIVLKILIIRNNITAKRNTTHVKKTHNIIIIILV